MIQVTNTVKRFDGFAALDGVSLSVPAGSVYGLVGPNGAGKSTLIRCLTGIYRQDEGELAIDGQSVWENEALKSRVAAIADDWYYFPQATIRDMCRFYRGFYPSFSMERYEKCKEVFQIDEKRPLRRRHRQEQGDHQQQLVEDVEGQIPRREEVGNGQHGAGVVVGGEDEPGRLRVPGHHILRGKALLHLRRVPGGRQLPAQPGAEGLLLLPGLADLKLGQDGLRLGKHSKKPLFPARGATGASGGSGRRDRGRTPPPPLRRCPPAA